MGIESGFTKIVNDACQKAINQVADESSALAKQMKKAASEVSSDTLELSAQGTQTAPSFIEKIKDILIDIKEELLPGFTKKTPIGAQDLTEDSIALVRMTDFKPDDGIIKSAREATRDADGVGATRNSLHFSLNHAVENEQMQNVWYDSKYGIVLPFDKAADLNGKGKFIAGNTVDLFTDGSVKIPKGSVIVRHNPKVPAGKLRVVNAEAIEDFKSAKGATIVETSENIHHTTNRVVEMMGYTHKPAKDVSWLDKTENDAEVLNNLVENTNKWKKFASKEGITDAMHTITPSARAENVIESINLLTEKNSWTVFNKGEKIIDYKESFLETILDIEKTAEKGYHMSFDLGKLKKIIEQSDTPETALKKVAEELKLKPMKSLSELKQQAQVDELTQEMIYANAEMTTGLSKNGKDYMNRTLDYYEKKYVTPEEVIKVSESGLNRLFDFMDDPTLGKLSDLD